MEAHLDIVSNCQEGAVVALLNGRLDANQIPAFDQWLDQQLDAQENTLVLDMSGLSYISSSGLRVILTLAKEMERRQRRLIICGLFGMVREVFMVSGFMEIFTICHTVDEALSHAA